MRFAHGRLVAAALPLLAAFGPTPGDARAQSPEDPVLVRSELVAPARVRALEPATLTVVLRSDADEAVPVTCRVQLDDQVLLAGQPDDTTTRFNQADRTLVWQGEIAPRGEARIAFDVIAPAWMAYYGFDVHAYASRPEALAGIGRGSLIAVDEAKRTSRPGGILVGPIIVGPYEAVLVGALLATLALGMALRARLPKYVLPGALAAFFGLIVVVGLLSVDGVRAVLEDDSILRSWQPTRATVVDAAAVHVPSSSSGVRRRTNQGRKMAPLVALRYTAGGVSRVSAGFWSDSHIFVSSRAARVVAPYVAGKTVTCYVDPARPWRFVLIRTPGFGHLFFAGLIALVAGIAWIGMRIRRSLRASPSISPSPTAP